MYELYWTNLQYMSDVVFDTLDEAIAYGRSKGYEFSVYHGGNIVCYARGVGLTLHIDNQDHVVALSDKLGEFKS